MGTIKWFRLHILVGILVASCSVGESPTVPPVSPSSKIATSTAQPDPSLSPSASSTIQPTASLEPQSPTPSATSTPGPIHIQDDFSSRSNVWGECDHCEWKDGALFYGPFPPEGTGWDQIFYIICEACGEHTHYRVAADVTYFEGYAADRTFGILAGLQWNNYLGAGTVTTLQHALYETFDFTTNTWLEGTFTQFGAVNPSRETNRIEVTIAPAISPGKADITVNVNGTNVIVLFNRDVRPSKVGLYLGWHSVGIKFDNFEFETDEEGVVALQVPYVSSTEASDSSDNSIFLSEITPSNATVGHGVFSVGHYRFDSLEDGVRAGDPIVTHGLEYSHGLYAHAPSQLVFPLQGQYQEFKTSIALVDSILCGSGAFFIIRVDGEEVYRSPRIRQATEPTEVRVDVSGGERLDLVTEPGGGNECDWTIWGDPALK